MAVKDALDLVKKNKVEIVDFKFVDVPGLWQHFSIPAAELTADLFEEGIGFDGSSIRRFQAINESDFLLTPDPDTAMMDPFTEHPTLSLICNVIDAVTRESYSRDPRYVAQKAEKYLKSSGIADISYWGPEIEFFIFDSVRFDQSYNHGFYYIDSEEGFWNSGNGDKPNLGYKIRYKEGYFPVPPMDQYQDLRSEMVKNMEKCGIKIEVHHHEVGTAGQTEIDMRFTTLAKMADQVLLYKYVIKNTARQRGKVVTVKPKRLEFRTPDPSCNPYFAFPAMLMAGLDGIRNKIEPPKPIDKDLYELEPEEAAKVKSMPGSLDQALDALEKDHEFLLRGDVFTKDVIETWLEYKRKKEVDAMRLRPHPHEFALYFDI